MSGRQQLSPEMQFVVDRLVAKVFQGDESKRGLAINCASVAIAALQDHTAQPDEDEVRVNAQAMEAIHRLLGFDGSYVCYCEAVDCEGQCCGVGRCTCTTDPPQP